MNYQSQYSNELNPYNAQPQNGYQQVPSAYVPPIAVQGYPMPVPQSTQGNGQAIAGLVLGIISMIAWLLPIIGLPVSIVGLVLANRGRRSLSHRTMATVGMVLSIIALVLTIINAIAGAAMAMH